MTLTQADIVAASRREVVKAYEALLMAQERRAPVHEVVELRNDLAFARAMWEAEVKDAPRD